LPTYDILGLNVFIPDLQDIENAVLTPVEDAVSAAINSIVSDLTSSFYNYIVNPIVSGFNAYVVQPIRSFVYSDVLPALTNLPGQIWSGLVNYVVNPISGALSAAWHDIVSGIATLGSMVSGGLASLGNGLYAALSTGWNVIVSGVQAAISTVRTDLSAVGGAIMSGLTGFVGSIGGTLSSLSAYLTSGFNSLTNSVGSALGSIGSQVSSAFGSIGNAIASGLKTIWSDLVTFFNDYVKPFFAEMGNAIASGLNTIQTAIKNAILSIIPRTPEDAFSSALGFAEIGIGTFVAGEIAALVVEAVYPTKHWGIPEALHKGLEYLGIAEITASLYGIVVESGWRVQLQYYFQYQLQYRRPDPATSIRALWYGVRTEGQVREDLRYEGYSNDFIDAAIKTAYKPLPPFILEKLIELQVVDDAFATRQLLKEGFDPADASSLLKAFQNLSLQGYQANAKSIVFAMFKDGFLDTGTATKILGTFAVPSDQQKWILTLANYQFRYEQQQKLTTLILDQYGKDIISADQAVSSLTALGMDPTRATILVKTKGITSGAAATKAQKAEILQQAIALPLSVS
jgi:hypothetical protein